MNKFMIMNVMSLAAANPYGSAVNFNDLPHLLDSS